MNITSYITLRQLGVFGGRHVYLAYANLVVAYVLLLVVLALLFLNSSKLPKKTKTL